VGGTGRVRRPGLGVLAMAAFNGRGWSSRTLLKVWLQGRLSNSALIRPGELWAIPPRSFTPLFIAPQQLGQPLFWQHRLWQQWLRQQWLRQQTVAPGSSMSPPVRTRSGVQGTVTPRGGRGNGARLPPQAVVERIAVREHHVSSRRCWGGDRTGEHNGPAGALAAVAIHTHAGSTPDGGPWLRADTNASEAVSIDRPSRHGRTWACPWQPVSKRSTSP